MFLYSLPVAVQLPQPDTNAQPEQNWQESVGEAYSSLDR